MEYFCYIRNNNHIPIQVNTIFEIINLFYGIVIMKVSYRRLVLSLLLSVILSLSKVKQRQKANGQNHLAARTVMVTINQNTQQSYIH